jgi:hypothetical protein
MVVEPPITFLGALDQGTLDLATAVETGSRDPARKVGLSHPANGGSNLKPCAGNRAGISHAQRIASGAIPVFS